jgi:two-component system response regulator CpxR
MVPGERDQARSTEAVVSVLLIDDDVELCALMREYFGEHGMLLESVHDGRRGLRRALSGGHDIVLLDIMMPELDGLEVLRQLRRQSSASVIMLTARNAPADRVAGLEAGADDYLPKPFGPDELLARIRAVLRRSGRLSAPAGTIEASGVRLHPARRDVEVENSLVEMTSTEFDVLEVLVRSAGRVVSRRELTAVLYQRPASPFDRVLDVHVSHLRKKLGSRGDLIRTVRGVGYLFCAEGPGNSGAEP